MQLKTIVKCIGMIKPMICYHWCLQNWWTEMDWFNLKLKYRYKTEWTKSVTCVELINICVTVPPFWNKKRCFEHHVMKSVPALLRRQAQRFRWCVRSSGWRHTVVGRSPPPLSRPLAPTPPLIPPPPQTPSPLAAEGRVGLGGRWSSHVIGLHLDKVAWAVAWWRAWGWQGEEEEEEWVFGWQSGAREGRQTPC